MSFIYVNYGTSEQCNSYVKIGKAIKQNIKSEFSTISSFRFTLGTYSKHPHTQKLGEYFWNWNTDLPMDFLTATNLGHTSSYKFINSKQMEVKW